MISFDNESARLARDREELASLIEQSTGSDGRHQSTYERLVFFRTSAPEPRTAFTYEPGLILVAQGAKQLMLGDDTYRYDETNYLITSFNLPAFCHVTQASPSKPYLCARLDFDMNRLGEMLTAAALAGSGEGSGRGLSVSPLDHGLLDAVLRLVRLLDKPGDLAVLGPLIEREIMYRLLTGPQGPMLRQLAIAGSRSQQIARAIEWLKVNYAASLRIEELAAEVAMSASSLHHHFRAITAMSPLQYQKQLRLQEARRLLLTERGDVASIAHRVGYESPSQFSREYSRQFGAPPLRDATELRRSMDADQTLSA
ncbi:MAG: AraC family transcriptional regulator [Rhodanobacter sp.]